MIHNHYLSKLDKFHNFLKNTVKYTSQKLSLGLKLMACMREICWAILDKLDAVHDFVARYIGALNPNDDN